MLHLHVYPNTFQLLHSAPNAKPEYTLFVSSWQSSLTKKWGRIFLKNIVLQGIPYPPITITIGVHVLLGFDKMCWGRSEMVSKKRISRFTGWMINIRLWCSINVSLMNSAQVCVWYITVWINQVSIDVQITISKMRKLHLDCLLPQQITPHDADQW